MKKSKSFKSVGDLKDIDLFRSDDKAITSDLSKETELHNEVTPSRVISTELTAIQQKPAIQEPSLGTVDQEDSYQQRLRWITRREDEVSVAESALIISKRAIDSAKAELMKSREKLVAEIRIHERRLEKLDQLETIEAELNVKRANLQVKN